MVLCNGSPSRIMQETPLEAAGRAVQLGQRDMGSVGKWPTLDFSIFLSDYQF